MIGIGNFLGILNLFINENNKNNKEIGSNKIAKIEDLDSSQNFGLFNFIIII
tara:strand:+ start:35 stop:190 length:156 start_codon:yes stop_codon:yes gene_type:complete